MSWASRPRRLMVATAVVCVLVLVIVGRGVAAGGDGSEPRPGVALVDGATI